jgi:hypothetical protein
VNEALGIFLVSVIVGRGEIRNLGCVMSAGLAPSRPQNDIRAGGWMAPKPIAEHALLRRQLPILREHFADESVDLIYL